MQYVVTVLGWMVHFWGKKHLMFTMLFSLGEERLVKVVIMFNTETHFCLLKLIAGSIKWSVRKAKCTVRRK